MSLSECYVCKKPLGQESKDLNWPFCHDHRTCNVCGSELTPRGAQQAIDTAEKDGDFQIICPRCLLSTRKNVEPTPESIEESINLSNLSRLDTLTQTLHGMLIPNMDVSQTTNEYTAMLACGRLVADMSLEQQFMHLRMLEACVAQTSILLKKVDKKAVKAAIEERVQKASKQAQREALTSSRPAGKPADDKEELEIGAFMKEYGLTDRKTALKKMSAISKAIAGLVAIGLSEEKARENIIEGMIKSGVLVRV